MAGSAGASRPAGLEIARPLSHPRVRLSATVICGCSPQFPVLDSFAVTFPFIERPSAAVPQTHKLCRQRTTHVPVPQERA